MVQAGLIHGRKNKGEIMNKGKTGYVPYRQRICTKHSTGFRIMGRHNHTSMVWVVGTFVNRYDADRIIDKVLEPMTGKAIIYRSEAF